MAAFWLKVIASDHVFYNGNCESLVVPAHDGEVGILPHMRGYDPGNPGRRTAVSRSRGKPVPGSGCRYLGSYR